MALANLALIIAMLAALVAISQNAKAGKKSLAQ